MLGKFSFGRNKRVLIFFSFFFLVIGLGGDSVWEVIVMYMGEIGGDEKKGIFFWFRRWGIINRWLVVVIRG